MARSAYVETQGAGATATTGVRGRQASRRRFVARAAAEQRKLETAGPSATCTAMSLTLCNECWRVIQPIWVLSADEKKKLQEEGRMFREIVFLNAEVTALQSQTFEE